MIDGSIYTKHQQKQYAVACYEHRQDWEEAVITKKGGVYSKTGQIAAFCCCTCTQGIDIGPFFAPSYFEATSCLGPMISMPLSAPGSSAGAHPYLAPPLIYLACTNSALGGPEEEVCDYAFFTHSGRPINPYPFHWQNTCYKPCYNCLNLKVDGLGSICYGTGGVAGCLMPWFTSRTDISGPPSIWNKGMYTAKCPKSCDGICIKSFDPRCCPNMWLTLYPASCTGQTALCVPGGTAGGYNSGMKHWDCDGDVLWMFDWLCFPCLCAYSPACAFQCSGCSCRFETHCTLIITKFCRPHKSFQYWSPIQPKCMMPWMCCKGCVFLTNCYPTTERIFCMMGFTSQGSVGRNRDRTRCALYDTGKISVYTCPGGVPMMDPTTHGDIIQHPTCANRLLMFGNGDYNSHTSYCDQASRNTPVYTVFNKSTCQIECSINFYAMIQSQDARRHMAKWYISSPMHLCNCGCTPCDIAGRLWLGNNDACPKCTVAACIQAITGCCATSLLAHCQGHDFHFTWGTFGGCNGTNLNLVGTGNFCRPNWYYNCCTDHLVFIGGILACGTCTCFTFGSTFMWLGAICFDLTNCCVSKVNQLWPSTDKCVNCKFVDPTLCCCLRHCLQFEGVVGACIGCTNCRTIGLDFTTYGSDHSSDVGGVQFIMGGVCCFNHCGIMPAKCCCIGSSKYFGCLCTGACASLYGGCNGCIMQVIPETGRMKAPFNVPLECIGWNTSEIMKNFWNIRWLGSLAYHPFSASAACRMQFNACTFGFGDSNYMFFPGFCRLCYGGCFCPHAISGGATMQCCCMFNITRTYMMNQTIGMYHCTCLCGGLFSGTGLCTQLYQFYDHECVRCHYRLTCCNPYRQGIACHSNMIFCCIKPCHLHRDATKRYACYLRINNNFSAPSYNSPSALNAKAPHKLNAGEGYYEGALRLYNEGIICSC
jgi:hypothetical protein